MNYTGRLPEATARLRRVNALLWEVVKLMLLIMALLLGWVVFSAFVLGFFDFAAGAVPL